MKKQFQGILYYLTTDIRYSLSIFWAIIGGLLLLTMILDVFIGGEHSTVQFNLSFPIYVFAGIAGFLLVKGTIPFLIKMGATRKFIFLSIIIYFIGLAAFNSVIANTLQSIASMVIGSNSVAGFTISEGESTYQLHHLADILENNGWLTRMVIDTSISFFLFIVFFIIGLIFYRYGLIGGFSFVAMLIFIYVFGISNGWLLDFFVYIFTDFSIAFFFQLLVVGLVIYLFSFLLLRRLTIN